LPGMANKLWLQQEGETIYVMFRGHARRAIFVDDRERDRLAERLGVSGDDFGLRVCEYCWMSAPCSGSAVGCLARQVKGHSRADPYTPGLVRRITSGEAPR